MLVRTNGRIQVSTIQARTKLLVAMIVACIPLALITACRSGFVADRDYQAFKKSLGNTSVTVFPAIVRVSDDKQYDTQSASKIADYLQSVKLASAKTSADEVKLTHGWHGSQATMLRESAEDFAAHIATHPIDTDYAILPEYLSTKNKVVGGIQCNVISKDGTPAFALVLNSHNDAFAKKRPTTPSDCAELLIAGLRDHLAVSK